MIDKVEVKQLRDLSPREIEHDNPELRRAEELAHFLGQLYNREVAEDDIVTVIRFSQIVRHLATCGEAASPLATRLADRRAEELGAAHLGVALLARDGEGGRDRRSARGAAVRSSPPHCGHARRELVLVLEEVALRVAACEAERHPVAERLSAFLLDPVALRLRLAI